MSLNHTSRSAELTDAHFTAIGRVVVEWANVEFLLRVVLARLLLTNDFLARSYTDRMPAAKVQEAIDEAVELQRVRYDCRIVDQEVLDEISVINQEIRGLRSTRNQFAHFCWSRSLDDQIFGTGFLGGVRTPKREKKDCRIVSTSELKTLHHTAYAIVEKLEKLISKLPEMKEDGTRRKPA